MFVRFKGKEDLPPEDQDIWKIEDNTNSVIAPGKHGGLFTFDKILLEVDQATMYEQAAQETVR